MAPPGTVQIRIRHTGGVRGVRCLLVPGVRAVGAAQAEEPEKSGDEDERVPAGVPSDLQADAALHDRRLRGRPPSRQSREEPGCLGRAT